MEIHTNVKCHGQMFCNELKLLKCIKLKKNTIELKIETGILDISKTNTSEKNN